MYGCIEGVFDFLLSPEGSRIFFRPLARFSPPSFETYLLGIVMKAILIKKDICSLHASAVVVEDRAIAFVGCNGFGKSSLAASFVEAGYALLTDDVLRVGEEEGLFRAYPGPAYLKLLPDSREHLSGLSGGNPMDPAADKWLVPVAAGLRCNHSVPLAAIYCGVGPERSREAKHISIDSLEAGEALQEILYGMDIDRIVEPDRVTSPFDAAKRIAGAVRVRRLSYPWSLASLPDVRAEIVASLRGL